MSELVVVAVGFHRHVHCRLAFHGSQKRGLRRPQRHAILRALGPGNSRLHLGKIQLQGIGEHGIRRLIGAKNALLFGVRLHQCHQGFVASTEAQISQRLRVHWKEPHGRAIFRRHICNHRAVGKTQAAESGAVELYKFSNYAFLAQHLRNRKHQVGGRRAFGQSPVQLETHHFRNQHRKWLAQHGRLGLDAAHAPAEYAQRVDHRGVRVRAYQRIRKCYGDSASLLGEHHAAQVLQIDLVADARIRRHHLEIEKCFLPPAQKRIAFQIALHLDFRVQQKRLPRSKIIHLHGMIDHQIRRKQRIDFPGIAAQSLHRVAHRRQIDHRRHAREILHQHARRHEGHFLPRRLGRIPFRQHFNIRGLDEASIFIAQEIFQQHLQRKGKPRNCADAALLQFRQAENFITAAAGRERAARAKAVLGVGGHEVMSSCDLVSAYSSAFRLRPRYILLRSFTARLARMLVTCDN